MNNPKTVLTSLLIKLVDSNARQKSCLNTIRDLAQMKRKLNEAIGYEELEVILNAHGITVEKEVNVPEFMEQYKKEIAYEDEA